MKIPSGTYYVASSKLQFHVHRSDILDVQRLSAKQKSWMAINADRLNVTHNATHYDTDLDTLYLDGWGLLELAGFLMRERPNAKRKSFQARLWASFPSSAFYPEVLKGTLYAATGREHDAPGDLGYFANAAIAAHPVEFAMLAAIWNEQPG